MTNLSELLEAAAEHFADRVAYQDGNERVTYQQLQRRVCCAANALIERRASVANDADMEPCYLAALLPNSVELFELFLIAAVSKITIIPVNTRLADAEVNALLEQIAPDFLVVDAVSAERIRHVDLPKSVHTIMSCGPEVPQVQSTTLQSFVYNELVSAGAQTKAMPNAIESSSDTFAQAFATSGTTGNPKLVGHTHGNVLAHVSATLASLGDSLDADDMPCWGHFTPMYHVGDAAFVWIGVAIGARHVFTAKPLDVENLASVMVKERVTCTKLVPTLVRLLVANKQVQRQAFPALRFILTGGDKPERELITRTRHYLGCDFVQGYGMTEATCHVAFKNESREPSDAGLTPVTGLDVQIVDVDGAPVPAGVVGEIAVRGATVFSGYLLTASSGEEHVNKEGFFKSGDAGYLDSSGRLFIRGRIKDMMIVGGENVFAKEVEAVANELEGVALSCAFGLPDALLGETVALAVVPERAGVSERDIIAELRGRLASFKQPRKVFLCSELPQTGSGKIKRAEVKALLNVPSSAPDAVVKVDQSSSIESDVIEAFQTVIGSMANANIDLQQSLFDMNIDSLDMLGFVTELENRFDCRLPDTFVVDQINLANMVMYLAAQGRGEVSAQGGSKTGLIVESNGMRDGASTQSDAPEIDLSADEAPKAKAMGAVQGGRPVVLILQTLGYLLRPGLVLCSVIPSLFLAVEIMQQFGGLAAFLLAPLLLLCVTVSAMIYLIVAKWLIVGRLHAKAFSSDSVFYCRWLMVHNLFRSVDPFIGVFRASAVLNQFYRLCGAKIGRRVVLETLDLSDVDLLSLGDDCVIARGANIQPSLVSAGVVTLRPVVIGAGSRVGFNATVLGGDCLQADSVVLPLSTVAKAQSSDAAQTRRTPAAQVADALQLVLTGYVAALSLAIAYGIFGALTANAGMAMTDLSMQSPLITTAGLILIVGLLRFGALPLVYFGLVCIVKRLLLPELRPGIPYDDQSRFGRFGNGLYVRMMDVPFFRWATQLFNMSELAVVMYRLLGCRIGRGVFFCAPYISAPELVVIGDEAMVAGNIAFLPVTRESQTVDVITLQRTAGVANSCVLHGGVTIESEALLGDLSFAPSGYRLERGAIAVGRPPRVIARTDFQPREVNGLRYLGSQVVLVSLQVLFGLTATVLSWLAILPGVAYLNSIMGFMWSTNTVLLALAAPVLLLLPNLFTLAAVPFAKMLFIRRFHSGEFPFFGWTYTRWVLLETLLGRVEEATTSQLNGTFLARFFYEAMGARVGSGALLLGSPIAGEFDLKDIGDNAALNHQSKCLAHSIKRHTLIFEPITVESEAVVQPFGIVEAGATVKQGATVDAAEPFHAARNAQGVRPYEKRYLNTHEFEAGAKTKLPKEVFDYFSAGAADELTLHQNEAIFSRIQVVPRVLRDVAEIDVSSTILGRNAAFPAMVAPIAMQHLAHYDAEIGMARAAATNSIPFILSMLSGTALEQVHESVPTQHAPKLLQLYLFEDHEKTKSLIARAEQSGFAAIVLTVDAPVSGKRERDRHNFFTSTADIRFANIVQEGHNAGAQLAGFDGLVDASANWDDIAELQQATSLPVYLKGILHPDDVCTAAALGVKGVMVSNHGGRQLDTSPTGPEMLPEICAALGSDRQGLEVYVDGGIRRGSDIFKALALGANGVLIGRPCVYGLATDGFLGAAKVMSILKDEFVQTMRLAGCRQLSDISVDFLREGAVADRRRFIIHDRH